MVRFQLLRHFFRHIAAALRRFVIANILSRFLTLLLLSSFLYASRFFASVSFERRCR